MSNPKAFILPISGLSKGFYEYDLIVDKAFYAAFPDAPIGRCDVQLHLRLDKRSREMILDFDFSGTVGTECDRCLASIDLPIEDQRQLVVQFRTETSEQEDEGEIIYLHPDAPEFDLAPFVYEMIVLALPMIRTFACRAGAPPYPCDEEMLDRIEASYDTADEAPTRGQEDDEDKNNPWDVLKDLNN